MNIWEYFAELSFPIRVSEANRLLKCGVQIFDSDIFKVNEVL